MAIHLQDLEFDLVTDIGAIEDDWQRLASDPYVSLHQSLLWCQTWAQVKSQQLLVLRGRLKADCYLLIPLVQLRKYGATILQLPATGYNNINTGLIQAQLQPPVALQDIQLAENKIKAALHLQGDLLTISNVPLLWRGRQNALTGLPAIQNQNQSFQLPLLDQFEATLAQLNAKRRRKKFRISQREAEARGGYRHAIAETADDKQRVLSCFFAQKAKRFASLGLPDVFSLKSTQDFFRELALSSKTIGKDRALELHYLELQGENLGQIISITGISRKADHCICQFGSIDEELAGNISPGELLFYHVIERENALGTKLFDFGIGDQRYKRSWCPVVTTQHDLYLPITHRGMLIAQALRMITKAKALIKGNPRLYGVLQRLRRQRNSATED